MKVLIQFLIVLSLTTCATNHMYNVTPKKSKSSILKDSDKELDHTFYLIGDAGKLDEKSSLKMEYLKLFNNVDQNSTLLFLGDNIYPKGFSKIDKEKSKSILDAQIELANNFTGKTIFIPGNHDWYSGVKGLKRQEDYIQKKLGKNTFLPKNGCPIEKVKISDDVVLLIVDSQWYISDWSKEPKINDNCEIKSRAIFWEELGSQIKSARGKTTLIALHHPMFTFGAHGGKYSAKSHLKPLPILGTLKNLIRKTSGISNADTSNPMYRELQAKLVAASQQNSKVIFLSGHEHNLQYIEQDNIPQIVSGSGSKKQEVSFGKGSQFSYSENGFAILKIFKDGSSKVEFVSLKEGTIVFENSVFDEKKEKIQQYKKLSSKTFESSIYSKSETEKSKIFTYLWGDRYRKYYGKKVTAPVLYLDTIYGGLTPVKKGGGNQSKSLRLKDKDGAQYVLRAMRKVGSQYIQATVFKDQYVQGMFENTSTEGLVMDVFTGSHPYASFVISDMCNVLDIYHTSPKLFYVPKQNALKQFNSEFGDALYMLETHPSKGHSDLSNFGYSDKIIGTYDLLKKIHKDSDIILDEKNYIRARLFDMVIGDWDRHQDQWKWVGNKVGDKTIYKPLPRDRDQAFSIMSDGAILSSAVALIPAARLLRKYQGDLKDVKGMNVEPYPLDLSLINQYGKSAWDEQVQFIQQNLKKSIIDKAFKNMPIEVQDETVEKIKNTLMERIDNLQKISDRYYKYLNKYTILTGTNKDDIFKIKSMENGNVEIEIYRNKKVDELYYKRLFTASEHKEIWIYGLDDEDKFEFFGKSKKIKLIVIGGQNNDSYSVENGKNIVIYDHKTKKNDVSNAKKARVNLTDNYNYNVYNFKKHKHTAMQNTPTIGFNPDDGLKLGVSSTFTNFGFKRNPFSSKHSLSVQYYLATQGFDLKYNAEWAHVFGEWNFGIKSTFASENFSQNFFGYGNSTDNPQSINSEEFDMDYNRIKQGGLSFLPYIKKVAFGGSEFMFSTGYQNVKIENTIDRFISNIFNENNSIFDRQEYWNTNFHFNYKNVDNVVNPTTGFQSTVDILYSDNLNNKKSFTQVKPTLAIDLPLSKNKQLVLATKLKGTYTIGDDFEFFQAATIGGNDGLRGFRNQRFTGKHAFYQNVDIRYEFNQKRTSVLPMSYGIYGGFDFGKVWVDNNMLLVPTDNNDTWNISYGGGLFLNATEMLSTRISAFNSTDGLRFTFGLGFDF